MSAMASLAHPISTVMSEIELSDAMERRCYEPIDKPLCDDRRLAARFAAGERAAAEEVLARFTPRLIRLVRRILGWRSDVDDVIQDIFVSAFNSRNKFRSDSRLETWLVRIAINRCRAFHRRRLLRGKLFAAWRDANYDPAAANLDRCEVLPDNFAITFELAATVRETVTNLPSKLREVVVLFYLEEMTIQQTADALGLKQNTVEVRLSRARKMLAKRLGKLMGDLP